MDQESILAVASRVLFFYFLNHSSSKLILVEVINSCNLFLSSVYLNKKKKKNSDAYSTVVEGSNYCIIQFLVKTKLLLRTAIPYYLPKSQK